jgi:quercetin dioxygenase-like cupin family protein
VSSFIAVLRRSGVTGSLQGYHASRDQARRREHFVHGRRSSSIAAEEADMLDKVKSTSETTFSHVKPADTVFKSDGLRDFFLYRDLGIAAATGGKVIAQLVIAHNAPERGTGWHRHEADFHIVIMLRGWARFMYEDKETLVNAGDCVHQRPGVRHYLFDYSPDMEYLEIVGPADFTTIDVDAPCEVPGPKGWAL